MNILKFNLLNLQTKEDIHYIIDISSLNNKKLKYTSNSESICELYFKNKGFNVIKITPGIWKEYSYHTMGEIMSIIKNEPEDFQFKKKGMPDFFIYKEKEYFFVECKEKNRDDKLSLDQINFLFKSPIKCFLFILLTNLDEIKLEDQID